MTSERSGIPIDRLEAALDALPEAQRRIYLLCARDGLPIAAAAERLGLEPEVAERLLADALLGLDRALLRAERPWWRRFW